MIAQGLTRKHRRTPFEACAFKRSSSTMPEPYQSTVTPSRIIFLFCYFS